jgi:aryl-alcohol dehydrogenase-like predicted oxidoreductase
MAKRSTIWRRMIIGGSPLDFRAKIFSAISISSSVQGEIAREKKCTPAQFALAWVMAQGEDIVPTPRTKRRKYLQEMRAR